LISGPGCRTGAVVRVSVAADAAQGDGPAGTVSLTNGRAVFSPTATNRVPGDANGVSDVFVDHIR
jgi:hypothetical protein